MVTMALAWTVKVPAVALVMVSVVGATLPVMPRRVGPVTVPGVPPAKVTAGVAKSGVPVPAGKAVTVMVKVSAWFTSFTEVNGLMLRLASTTFCGSATAGLVILG